MMLAFVPMWAIINHRSDRSNGWRADMTGLGGDQLLKRSEHAFEIVRGKVKGASPPGQAPLTPTILP
jgi:hypothetical protein